MEGHVAIPRASMGGGGTRSRIFAITENDYEYRAKIIVPDDVNLTYSLKMCTDFGSTYGIVRAFVVVHSARSCWTQHTVQPNRHSAFIFGVAHLISI